MLINKSTQYRFGPHAQSKSHLVTNLIEKIDPIKTSVKLSSDWAVGLTLFYDDIEITNIKMEDWTMADLWKAFTNYYIVSVLNKLLNIAITLRPND